MHKRSLSLFVLAICLPALLSGCALPGTVSAPTPYPADYIPTVIYLTAQAINAATMAVAATPTSTDVVLPALTPTPTVEQEVGTPLPTATYTPAAGVPLAAIQINSPGPMSKIVSPIQVHAMVTVDEGYKVETALYDETGQLISRPALIVFTHPGSFPVSVKLPFEIRAAGETGVVQISTKDSHGRIQSLNSVRVLLLSTGSNQINPPGNQIYERVAFYDLPIDAHVSGGTLTIKGSYAPVNDQPVILELMNSDGKSLGLRVLSLPGRESQYFETTIPFKVTQETAARLYIYQDDDLIQGRAYLYSQAVALEP